MSPAALVFVGKLAVGAVVGTVVGKAVAKITGSDVLGMVAGSLAAGGLGFTPGKGFDWSFQNIGKNLGLTDATNDFVAGGSALTDTQTSALMGNTGAVDLLGASAPPAGQVAGVAGGGEVGATLALPGTASPAASGVLDATATMSFSPDQIGTLGENVVAQGKPIPDLTEVSAAPTAPTAPTGAQGGFMDKVTSGMGWMEDHPKITEIGSNMVMKAMEPDPLEVARETAIAKANAEADAKSRFQTTGYRPSERVSPLVLTPQERLARYRDTGKIDELTASYANRQSPNWRMLIDAIRNPPEEGAVA